MFRAASKPSGRTGRAWWLRTRGGRTKDPIIFVLFLMAATSLGMGVLGGIALFKLRNEATDQLQPYVATDVDLSLEKAAQRSAMMNIVIKIQNRNGQNNEMPVATIDPSYEKRTHFQKKKSLPNKSPVRQQKLKPSTAQHYQAPAMSASEQAQALSFLTYLADQLAGIHVDLRNVSSRVAVVESQTHQLQDKGWYEWLALGVTLAGIIQGLLGSAVVVLKWRQTKAALAPA